MTSTMLYFILVATAIVKQFSSIRMQLFRTAKFRMTECSELGSHGAGLLLWQVAGHREPLSYLVLIENDGLSAKVTGGPSSVVWPRYFAVEGTLVVVRAILSTRQKLTETLARCVRPIQRDPGRFFNPVEPRKRGEEYVGF